jgi:Ti-type conjugative transfer relaxase TraA
MAIYHFSAKVIGRASGSSALAAAAYRSASRLEDERLGRAHDFTHKAGVIHSEVLLPEHAPPEFADRERLWNAVEAGEVRKDAQLAREVEMAIPRELTPEQGIALVRDFAQGQFVHRGMIADLNVHWDIGADGQARPHAHVMLSLRSVDEEGFGAKQRDWNRTELLKEWREAWAAHVNQRLAELDIDARVDHRSFEDRGIELEPQHKIGAAGARRLERGEDAERAEDHHRIARENGEKIIAEPRIALDALTHQQATFTARDLQLFLHRHSDGKDQFDRAFSAVRTCPELIALGEDGKGVPRYTSREMIAFEQRLERASLAMAQEAGRAVGPGRKEDALEAARRSGLELTGEQRHALDHVTGKGKLSVVIGYAGAGKSAMLGVAREAWAAEGFTVRGAALSGIAAESLESGSAIPSRTLASLERSWENQRDVLTARDVLVIDEAGMIGSRQMERVIGHAHEAGAKVVLVGDPEQLQAIEAGAALRAIAERVGAVEITEVRRQVIDWQRVATRQLATGRTSEALERYAEHGAVQAAETRDQARRDLVDRWNSERQAEPDASRIILAHTNAEVRALNDLARERRRETGQLGPEVVINTERGEQMFAEGDRILFLRNEKSLGVKNGSLGTVEGVTRERLAVRLDDGRSVAFDPKDYAHLDHGYAVTIHKAQGVTVDRAHVLATPGLDRHGAYVALSRHRDGVALHYGTDDFASSDQLARTLSRQRSKDMASDYAQRRGIDSETAVQPRDLAIARHARAVSEIFQAHEQDRPRTEAESPALHQARCGLDAFDPHASRDLEQAYRADPELAHETAAGRLGRAVRTLKLEAELRASPERRADRFVQRWRQLEGQREQAYTDGDYAARRRITTTMGQMAMGLERDAQVESILASRKRELGLGSDAGRSLGRTLAWSIGFDMGRSRGLGI